MLFRSPICIPFISFSSLFAVGKTSKTMLNNSGESRHPCLVPDFRGNGCSFSPLRMNKDTDLLENGLEDMGKGRGEM